jgi:hypothetical protein
MGWDRGRYYTRSRKVNGRVVRKQGLAVPDVEDRRFLLDRLRDLYEETGRDGEAKAVREELENFERPRPTPRSTPALPPDAEARSRTAGTWPERREMPVERIPAIVKDGPKSGLVAGIPSCSLSLLPPMG